VQVWFVTMLIYLIFVILIYNIWVSQLSTTGFSSFVFIIIQDLGFQNREVFNFQNLNSQAWIIRMYVFLTFQYLEFEPVPELTSSDFRCVFQTFLHLDSRDIIILMSHHSFYSVIRSMRGVSWGGTVSGGDFPNTSLGHRDEFVSGTIIFEGGQEA